ncbi:MAG: radical SAM protein [Candidatus Micrarchaeia archaeon]
MRIFQCRIPNSELERIGAFSAEGNSVEFDCSERRARFRFNQLLQRAFSNLRNVVTGRRAIYIHRNSGIPLIGSNSFGIVDRNTSIVEVKPITGCNLDCIFCSVDEGVSSKDKRDVVVEEEYLVEEFRKLAEFKRVRVEAHINASGEPLLYSRIVDLVRDLRSIPNVGVISMDTNGVMLTEDLALRLRDAGLTRFNISISGFSQEAYSRMSGSSASVDRLKDVIRFCSGIAEVLIAPVWVPGFNDSEIEELIAFAKRLNVRIGIQNFLEYERGRRPTAQLSMEEFRARLKALEQKHGVKLLLSPDDFGIVRTERLPKPFRKGDIVNAYVASEGRGAGEFIGVCSGRNITLLGSFRVGSCARVRILRSKHNIFLARRV